MSFDRPPRSQVVQTGRTERIESESVPKWTCDCGTQNLMSRSHCTSCSLLRKEDRQMRMVARANMGLGKGGGYFERGDSAGRGKAEAGDVKGGLDEYGRRRADANVPAVTKQALSEQRLEKPALSKQRRRDALSHQKDQKAAAPDVPEAQPEPDHGGESNKPVSKAEKQKLALARLRERKRLSPPKPCHFREKSSRSRSLERRRESVRWR
ncbi:unnamed protein product [Symbiodinium natans]|uniref:Uncharacterized protein n=1 Tax=Symbiodinium natans TaxID=878477 RepID=A0A812IAB2_9DINO|nr:unnamed protein product [Symbiodinium natans]